MENYRDWVLGIVIPRFAEENTKFVTLDDCSPFSILGKASSVLGPIKDLIKAYQVGIVIFLPNIAWATWWNPLINLTKANIKIASAPDQAIGFETDYFQDAGVTPPPDLSI